MEKRINTTRGWTHRHAHKARPLGKHPQRELDLPLHRQLALRLHGHGGLAVLLKAPTAAGKTRTRDNVVYGNCSRSRMRLFSKTVSSIPLSYLTCCLVRREPVVLQFCRVAQWAARQLAPREVLLFLSSSKMSRIVSANDSAKGHIGRRFVFDRRAVSK